ncbi:ATP-binding cassette sub-family A member 1-like [Tropilaelaps mercedesae]|uniref:ATP-binding cassette sub-family A member 1-like n=1 Tax=Tropilaelaps mercedesae TaxID=418985 RepID=A0A1V9XLH3_9ACAR|nr:ATP-binding cassette sub-family A member 1-like [Tropilaelaps mercedesae]
MMGLPDLVYWMSQFLVGFTTMCILICLAWGTLCFPIDGTEVYTYSDPWLILLVLMIIGIGQVLLSLLITSIVNSPVLGGIFAMLAYLLQLLTVWILDPPLHAGAYFEISSWKKLLSSLLPITAFCWAGKIIAFWEQDGIGAQWNNLLKIAHVDDNISLSDIIDMVILSYVVFIALIFYIDAVVPWQAGIPKHPLFFLKRSYWYGSAPSALVFSECESSESSSDPSVIIEAMPGSPVIRMEHVTHHFRGASKLAVDNLSVTFYRNQISVILGHNGAGKTTTMNMLTGLFPPTEGEIFINGYNIKTDTRKARRGIGLCPQHNVIFEDLTVEEHLRFFSEIKGASIIDTKSEIETLLQCFDLEHKRHTLSVKLPGGMKRKLCLANAMVGGSTILILDEVTAGMDPQARRAIWSILQEARRSRTIVMTTHYMEEADILGDRIAFLSRGKLKCAGSPIFLKKKFETGYSLRCATVSSSTDVFAILNRVQMHLGCKVARLTSKIGLEFCINLGFPEVKDLLRVFRDLEAIKADLGITSFGVSVTTMEDVFLKVGQMDNDLSNVTDKLPQIAESLPRFVRVTGRQLCIQQFCALFVKRIHMIKREWSVPLFLFALPSLLAVLFCLIFMKFLEGETVERDPLDYSFRSLREGTIMQGFLEQTTKISEKTAAALEFAMSQDAIQVNPITQNTEIDQYLQEQGSDDGISFTTQWAMGVAGASKNSGPVLWFNAEPLHFGGAALVCWHTALLRQLLPKSEDIMVKVMNQPLGLQEAVDQTSLLFVGRFIAFLPISLLAAFLTCSLIMFPIQERSSKAKLLQQMTGVHGATYYGSAFLFDFLVILISTFLVTMIFVVMNPGDAFTVFPDTWRAVWLLFCEYGCTMMVLSYLFACFFNSPVGGLTTMISVTAIAGGMLVLMMSVAEVLALIYGDDADASSIIQILSFVPPFAVVWGFTNIHLNAISKGVCEKTDNNTLSTFCLSAYQKVFQACCHPCPNPSYGEYCFKHESPFQLDIRNGAGYQMAALLVVGLVGVFLLFLTEAQVFGCFYALMNFLPKKCQNDKDVNSPTGSPREIDSDVEAERLKVESAVVTGQQQAYALVAHRLVKEYGFFRVFRAVDNVSFAVGQNECFGLLGVNGAGKSTVFSMLTGDLPVTKGNAYIGKQDLRTMRRQYQCNIGFCPQYDAILDTMSGREMLELFCSLRGVPYGQWFAVIESIVALVDLENDVDKATVTYSGGNKRKLSVALAMVGNPPVVFLDEPTAGIDPDARRKIWTTLSKSQRDLGTSLVLTSHSMDECESLCGRIAIMVNGTFKCLGSTQHLKAKFGQGFTVLIKLKTSDDETIVTPKVCKMMEKLFPSNFELKDSHQCMLHFHVTDADLLWSELFERVELLKKHFDFEDIVASDTSLEQIFLQFAKRQRGEDADEQKVSPCQQQPEEPTVILAVHLRSVELR